MASVPARMRPPCAMTSSSRADLSWIIARSPTDRAQRARRHLAHVADGVHAGDARAVRAEPVENGRRLRRVDGEAAADRLRLVVLAAHELPAVLLVARLAGLAPGVRRLAHVADGPRGETLDELLVVDVEAEDAVDLPSELAEGALQPLGLRRRAHDAVEERPVAELGLRERLLHDAEDHDIGNEIAAVHRRLRFEA